MQLYRKIWDKFVATQAKDYEESTGVPIKLIRRIGYSKFIRANGWESISDVDKWRTDKLNVIPCPYCNHDFGILDDTLGLCDKCLPKIDLKRFYTDIDRITTEHPDNVMELTGKAISAFLVSSMVRKAYLKKDVATKPFLKLVPEEPEHEESI